tara:strand:+ start:638 stop:763 length:126 start_codon:yes stop_codon:yes gene_type:complete
MRKNELIAIGSWVAMMLCILMIIVVFNSCDSGWSIAGWEVK